jgi:GNAT superfamily N-acetyltransferase
MRSNQRRWHDCEFEFGDGRSRLDLNRIVAWLSQSYWAGSQPEAAIRHSLDTAGVVLGLYHGDMLIGCTRAVTDFTRFAFLSDVNVEPACHGRGFVRWLVQAAVDHDDDRGGQSTETLGLD